jgi:outer membrane biosynthesis protein TonB
MRTAGHRPDDTLAPALAGAVALHLALLAVLLFHPAPPMSIGTAVPITLVAHAPTTDSRPAVQAPVEQAAQTPEPVPEAKAPEPPPPPPPQPRRPELKAVETPAPQPRPAPAKTALKPTPQPKQQPQEKPSPPQPPTKSKPAAHSDSFSLDSLQVDVNKSLKAAKPHPAFAARGPIARPETATVARVDAGKGVSQSDVAGLAQLLTRLWNVNCGLEETVVVPISFKVGDDGGIEGAVSAHGLEGSHDPAVSVAARRAIDAVRKAAPYGAQFRNNGFTVNFDAKKACASG